MVLRGSMDLRSYDRLFPNQDVLPDGGFGNLIAAPLHGGRRKDGLTLFLDLATLEPYEDQWAFLSTLDRLSPGEAEQIARRAGRTPVGADVTTMSRSQATRVQPPLPAVVNAELSAGLRVNCAQLPAAALATFKHAASMANQKSYELQRLRKSTRDPPRFVRGYDLTRDGDLVLPRGLRHMWLASWNAADPAWPSPTPETPATPDRPCGLRRDRGRRARPFAERRTGTTSSVHGRPARV
jgi:TOTE conflict system primase-like protein